MRLGITTSKEFAVSPEYLFDFTNDAANFGSFVGFGPIPGIRKAIYETPGKPALGSRRRILETDGAEHVEEIVTFERPIRHVSRITGVSAPFSWLVRHGEDDWKFTSSPVGTRVDRRLSFELTTPLAAVVAYPLLHLFMRAAIKRDLQNIERACVR